MKSKHTKDKEREDTTKAEWRGQKKKTKEYQVNEHQKTAAQEHLPIQLCAGATNRITRNNKRNGVTKGDD